MQFFSKSSHVALAFAVLAATHCGPSEQAEDGRSLAAHIERKDRAANKNDPSPQPENPELGDVENGVAYLSHVKPVLDRLCLSCHSSHTFQGAGLSFDQADMLADKEALTARIIDSLRAGSMPPVGALEISAEDRDRFIELLGSWIDSGYPIGVEAAAEDGKEEESATSDSDAVSKPDAAASQLPLAYEGRIKEIVDRKCLSCHNATMASGGIILDRWDPPGVDPVALWTNAAQSVVAETMPPASSALTPEEIDDFTQWLVLGVPRVAGDVNDVPVQCDTETIPASSIKRLSDYHVRNTLYDVLGQEAFYFSMPDLFSFAFSLLPDDDTLSRLPGNSHEDVGPTLNEVQFVLAKHLGKMMTNNLFAGRWPQIYQPCMDFTGTPEQSCLETFVSTWGQKMFRRPLSAAEVTRYVDRLLLEPDNKAAAELAWTLWAISPKFLYLLYDQGEPDPSDPGLIELTLHERAAQMAYFLTGRGPDDLLIAKANDGSLADETTYRQQFERLLVFGVSDAVHTPFDEFQVLAKEAPKYEELHWNRFFGQWFGLVEIPRYDDVSDVYIAGTGDSYFTALAPREILQNVPGQDVVLLRDFSYDFITSADGRFEDYFTAHLDRKPDIWVDRKLSYIPSVILGWPNSGIVPDLPERRGFLTHWAPNMIRQNHNYANPIFKGIWANETFFCKEPDDFPTELATPSNTAIPARDVANQHLTTRELVEGITSHPDCQACHRQWNALGFVLDEYGAMGEFRAVEKIYKTDGSSVTLLNELPIDTTATVSIDGVDVTVTGAQDLQAKIAASKDAQSCYVSKLVFNHGFGREVRSSDQCFVTELTEMMVEPGASIKDMLFQALWSPKSKFKRLN